MSLSASDNSLSERTSGELAGASERRLLTLTHSYWPADDRFPLLDLSLGDFLRRLAAEVPDRIALVEAVGSRSERRRWSYSALLTEAEAVARALLSRFTPGERIAIWSPSSAEWVLLQQGAALAGLPIVTVNPAYLSDEVGHVLKTSGAVGIVHAERYRGVDMSAICEDLRASLPDLRTSICFSDWAEFVASGSPGTELPYVAPDAMAQIQFTSGTTGRPKGACLHHRGLINAARFAAARAGFPDGGAWLSAMPLFHVGGCAGSELGAFSSRGTFVMQPAFDASAMLELIESEEIAHLHAVPTMLVALLEHPDFARHDYSRLRTIMSGGSPVPAELIEHAKTAFGCRFTINFGQTELNGVISQSYPDDTPVLQSSTIGQPSPRMEVKIADPNSGDIRPLDQPGEIWARGYQTMLGYFNTPEDTASTLTQEGWLKTGDLGVMDRLGYLRIVGRLKDSVIRGGENIYPREIEATLEFSSRHSRLLRGRCAGRKMGRSRRRANPLETRRRKTDSRGVARLLSLAPRRLQDAGPVVLCRRVPRNGLWKSPEISGARSHKQRRAEARNIRSTRLAEA